MSGVRFPDPLFDEFAQALLADGTRETCGLALASYEQTSETWVVRNAMLVPEDAYERRGPLFATLAASFVVEVANRCSAEGVSAIFAHSHLASEGPVAFSGVDDAGEAALLPYMSRCAGPGPHLALVVAPGSCSARRLGGGGEVEVWQVGRQVQRRSPAARSTAPDDIHDRQIRAFGEPGQRLVRSLRIGIVGLGGTGSVVAQQLAYLGVPDLLLVDPDVVEPSNLNRLVGAAIGDVGLPKADVAAREARITNPACRVEPLRGDVVDDDVARRLLSCDFVFSCTDTHASRMVVSQLAYQYLVPAIDLGVSITVANGKVTHVTGRVQMLAPGLECLVCTGALNYETIRREMLTPAQRAADPYVHGVHEPQPAVISLNSTMASLAVTMLLGAVTPVPAGARFQYYDGIRGTVKPMSATREPECVVCSPHGALAKGSSAALPTRVAGWP